MPTKKTAKKSTTTQSPPLAADVVHVQIAPGTRRQIHVVRGVKFVAGQVRSYDLSDPVAREFVDGDLRPARVVHGREDTPRVFLVETEAESLRRLRAQEEARLAPVGSPKSPIKGQVPQKPAPTKRVASDGFARTGAPAR